MSMPNPSRDKAHMALKCQVDPTLLGLLRDFVCSAARHLGFSEKEVAEIEISVDEACANAMEHAYNADGSAAGAPEVLVELYMEPEKLTIKICDSGSGKPDLDQPMDMVAYLVVEREKFRGLGLVLMR